MGGQLDPSLAVAIASQIAAGLAAGYGREQRALMSLNAIGLMVLNASEDERVREILVASERMRVRQGQAGDWIIETGNA
jgi:hypothetical protein